MRKFIATAALLAGCHGPGGTIDGDAGSTKRSPIFAREVFANNCHSTLSLAQAASDAGVAGTLSVASNSCMPDSGTFTIIVDSEYEEGVSLDGGLINVIRGTESTVATPHNIGALATVILTQRVLNQFGADFANSGGDLVGQLDAAVVMQVTGDGGTNEFGGVGTIPIVAHESILAYGSTHPVHGVSKAITSSNAGQTTLGSFTPASSTFNKWTLSVTGVNSNWFGYGSDGGLVDYYEADFVFTDTVAIDGGLALNPATIGGDGGYGTTPSNASNVSRGSCSGTGCNWFTIVSTSAGAINVIVVGGTSQTVKWNAALQLQEQH